MSKKDKMVDYIIKGIWKKERQNGARYGRSLYG